MVECCSFQLGPGGQKVAMTVAMRKQVNALVSDWAQQAFRVIALAHKDLTAAEVAKSPSEEDLHNDLVLDCLVAIQDPLRPEVLTSRRRRKRGGGQEEETSVMELQFIYRFRVFWAYLL